MTISVTPQPLFAPPRVQVDVAVPSGAIMDSVAVYRTAFGVRTALRSQPAAGFASRTVYDYEAPYGVPLVYDWVSSYVDSSVITNVYSTVWASLSPWVQVGGSWSVSGGRARWSGGDSVGASLSLALSLGQGRVDFASIPVGVSRIDFGGFYVDLVGSRLVSGAVAVPFVRGSGVLSVTATATSASVLTSAGSASVASAVGISRVSFVGAVAELAYSAQFANVSGSGSGQTNYPQGVAVDSTGAYYVLDSGNSRVQKFSSAGAFVLQWGTAGSGNGQFSGPQGIAIDSSDNIYIADKLNNRIQKFTTAGTYVTKWGSSGTTDGLFSSPSAIACDAAGFVYVIEDGTRRVQKFNSSGVFVSKFGMEGTADGQFIKSTGIAVDSSGYIYVVDRLLNRVQKFTSAFAFVAKFGSQGAGDGQFNYPSGIAVGADKTIYVTEDPTSTTGVKYRFQKFAFNGDSVAPTFVASFGKLGVAPGDFQQPRGIAVKGDGTVAVVDATNGVQLFTQTKTSIDAVTAYSFGQRINASEKTTTITLTPTDGWLIHPANPALSFPLSANNGALAGIDEFGPIRNDSNATIHKILGSDVPVTTTNGNRSADTGSLAVAIETNAEELALKALLRDETPILINFPPSMGTFFDYGFYQVGDTTRTRLLQRPGHELRKYDLPLTQVRSPQVTQQNVGWSYANLAIAFDSYAKLIPAFNTYAAMTTNSRNAGY